MKKLLTVLAITAIAMTQMFAMVQASGKSAQVQLVNTINETPLTYELAYDGSKINDATSEYKIAVSSLTADGKTKDFTVTSNSNLNSYKTVSVVVTPETFVTTINGSEKHDSNILPVVNTDKETNVAIISAGKHLNYLVNTFFLSWSGDENITAGNYVSNVRINYTIQ